MLTTATNKITEILGDKAEYLLNHECKTISKEKIHLPGPDFIDRIWIKCDRNP
jgi:class I fructose-bisphosphate aldolase